MRLTFLLLLASLSQIGFSQTTGSAGKGWKLGIGVSPDIAYRTLRDNREPYSSLIISMRNELEQPRTAYSAGVYLNYSLNDSWAIGTGLVYSLKGYDVSKHRFPSDDIRTFVYIEPHYVTGTYQFQFIDVPLTAVFTLGKSRLRWISNLGVVGSFLWSSNYTSTSEYDDGRSYSWRSPQHGLFDVIDIGAMISTGASYRMTEKLDLRVEPSFRHALLSTRNSAYATTLFWNAGVNISAFLDLR